MTTKGVFPVGIDYELFAVETLAREWPRMSKDEKEHLTLRFYGTDGNFRVKRFHRPPCWPQVTSAYVVDTRDDYARVSSWMVDLSDRHFGVRALLELSGG
jgi:spore coat polysaccharide biosynthesis protein SpsF (cytidylyltransferase family)